MKKRKLTPKQKRARRAAYMRRWRKANPEKAHANDRASYRRNREQKLARCRVYRQENREATNASKRAWLRRRLARDPEWHQQRKEKQRRYARERERQRRRLLYGGKTCVDCGATTRLEYDHVRGRKRFTISQRLRHALEGVMREIAKCEIRCRRCHRARHDQDNRRERAA